MCFFTGRVRIRAPHYSPTRTAYLLVASATRVAHVAHTNQIAVSKLRKGRPFLAVLRAHEAAACSTVMFPRRRKGNLAEGSVASFHHTSHRCAVGDPLRSSRRLLNIRAPLTVTRIGRFAAVETRSRNQSATAVCLFFIEHVHIIGHLVECATISFATVVLLLLLLLSARKNPRNEYFWGRSS